MRMRSVNASVKAEVLAGDLISIATKASSTYEDIDHCIVVVGRDAKDLEP